MLGLGIYCECNDNNSIVDLAIDMRSIILPILYGPYLSCKYAMHFENPSMTLT